MKIVEVHWLDACCEDHEATKQELQKIKLVPRWHLGYVIEETDTDIFIVPELNGWHLIIEDRGNDGKNAIRIPKGVIKSLRALGDGGLSEF